MKRKNYKKFVIFFAVIVAITAIYASIQNNSWLLLGVIIVDMVTLTSIKSRIDETIEDERAYQIAEKSSRVAFVSYCAIGGVGSAILSQLNLNPKMFLIIKTISVSVGIMLFIYLISYWFYSKKM